MNDAHGGIEGEGESSIFQSPKDLELLGDWSQWRFVKQSLKHLCTTKKQKTPQSSHWNDFIYIIGRADFYGGIPLECFYEGILDLFHKIVLLAQQSSDQEEC